MGALCTIGLIIHSRLLCSNSMILIGLDMLSDSVLFAKWTYTKHVTEQIINRCLSDDDLCDHHHGNGLCSRISMMVYPFLTSLFSVPKKYTMNVVFMVRNKRLDMKSTGLADI